MKINLLRFGKLARLALALMIAQSVLMGSVIIYFPIISNGPTKYNWLQFNGDPQHSGWNTREGILSPANVAGLKMKFQISLPAAADGAPVLLTNVTTPGGVRDLIFVTTSFGHILAVDAQSGSIVWSHQNGPGNCKINNGSRTCYTTSSPAIDPNLAYVYAYGLDGKVHKYQVGDGTEILDAHWPEVTTLKAFDEKGSSALAFATVNGTTYLYMANGGYPGDAGDYQGHITAINLSTGSQTVFNAACSNQAVHFVSAPGLPDCSQVQTAIWARPGVVYDANTNRIYMATGNGIFDPATFGWGDSVFALNPDGTGSAGKPLDSYTPTNQAQLDAADADLGSTAPAIFPSPVSSKYPNVAVQGGKDQKLRLINLDNLSGLGGPGHTGGEIGAIINIPQGGELFAQPAMWMNPVNGDKWTFIANSNGISGLKLVVDGSGNPSLSPVWQKGPGGFSPIIANGVLYYATSAAIEALDPLNGNLLWSSSLISGIHWESPIVANGFLYITDESKQLIAYSLY